MPTKFPRLAAVLPFALAGALLANDAEAYHYTARRALDGGRIQEAVAALEKAIALDPANTRYAHELADIVSHRHRWTIACPTCTYRLLDGDYLLTFTGPNAEISVSLREPEQSTRVDVVVKNVGERPFEVRPELFKLYMTSPGGALAYRSAESLIAALQDEAAHKAALLGITALFARDRISTRTALYGTWRDGSGTADFAAVARSTTTIPNYIVQARAYQLQDRAIQSARDAADCVRRVTLRANTLDPGQFVGGAVFFERNGAVREYSLVIRIEDDYFYFPLRTTEDR